jgi:hypothetical protein
MLALCLVMIPLNDAKLGGLQPNLSFAQAASVDNEIGFFSTLFFDPS